VTGQLPNPLPDGTRELGQHESGRGWLDQLPGLLDEVVEQWQLSIGEAFPDASASLTLRATTADGEPVVLRLQYPHREAEHEAAALAQWDGNRRSSRSPGSSSAR
jgi:streptomycin 6-kinase